MYYMVNLQIEAEGGRTTSTQLELNSEDVDTKVVRLKMEPYGGNGSTIWEGILVIQGDQISFVGPDKIRSPNPTPKPEPDKLNRPVTAPIMFYPGRDYINESP